MAALAVNLHLWGAGSNVAITCADTLAEPGWPQRALAEQEQALSDHHARLTAARLLALELFAEQDTDG